MNFFLNSHGDIRQSIEKNPPATSAHVYLLSRKRPKEKAGSVYSSIEFTPYTRLRQRDTNMVRKTKNKHQKETETPRFWAECTNLSSCPTGVKEGIQGWEEVDEKTMDLASHDLNWKCSTCCQQEEMSPPSQPMTVYDVAQNTTYSVSQFTPQFFDEASNAWMANKVRRLDENGFTVGYRYKNPKEMRLWTPPLKRKRRRRRYS